MNKHTPGPWHAVSHYCDSISVVDSEGFEHVSAAHTAILLDYNTKLGICHWADSPEASREVSEEEQAANSCLIAAAPELLSALKALFGADMEYCMMGDGKEEQIEAIAAARAAIAKATGESA